MRVPTLMLLKSLVKIKTKVLLLKVLSILSDKLSTTFNIRND